MSGVVDLDPSVFESGDPQRRRILQEILERLDLEHVTDTRARVDEANRTLSGMGLQSTTAAEVADVVQRRAVEQQRAYFAQLQAQAPTSTGAWLRRWRAVVVPILRQEGTDDHQRTLAALGAALERAGLPRLRSWEELRRYLSQPVPEEEPGYVPAPSDVIAPTPAPPPVEQPGARTPAARHRRREVVQEQWVRIWHESRWRYPLPGPVMDEQAQHDAARLLDAVNRRLVADGEPTVGVVLLREELEELGHRWVTPPSDAVEARAEDFDVFVEPDPVEEALRGGR